MGDNSAGFAALDAQIARVQNLGVKFVRDAVPEVADELRDELQAQIAAGRSPDGQAWEPRQEDGGKPLRNAAAAVAVAPVGTMVFFRVKGPEARHSRGIAKGGIVRQILPSKLPPSWADKIRRVLKDRFEKAMGV